MNVQGHLQGEVSDRIFCVLTNRPFDKIYCNTQRGIHLPHFFKGPCFIQFPQDSIVIAVKFVGTGFRGRTESLNTEGLTNPKFTEK